MAAGRGVQLGLMHETRMNGHRAGMLDCHCSTSHPCLPSCIVPHQVSGTTWKLWFSHQHSTRQPTGQHVADTVSPSATPSVRRLLLFPRYSRAALEVSPRTTCTSCPRMTCRRQCVLTAPLSPVTWIGCRARLGVCPGWADGTTAPRGQLCTCAGKSHLGPAHQRVPSMLCRA